MTNILTQWWERRQRTQRAQDARRPSVNITDDTVWEIRLNRVRTGSITEQAIRRIERDLKADRRLRLRAMLWPVGQISGFCWRLVRMWVQQVIVITALAALGACSIWRVDAVQWLHDLARMSPAQIGQPLHLLETFVLIMMVVTTLSYLVSHLDLTSSSRDPIQHTWYEEVRLAAQIAPLGQLELVSVVAGGIPERKVEMQRLPSGHVTVWL